MNKTKIEWVDGGYTWNPVTGCLHGCDYCYARRITQRFDGHTYLLFGFDSNEKTLLELDRPYIWEDEYCEQHKLLYPNGFGPTFHRYRLGEPARRKTLANVFVCSMGDLFGDWVPDEWIQTVFEACEAAPQHRYLFLTKNPRKYDVLSYILPENQNQNYWFGFSADSQETYDTNADHMDDYTTQHNTFASLEPLLGPITMDEYVPDWIIVGAMTGPLAKKHPVKREWLEAVHDAATRHGIPLFFKDSLRDVWGEPLPREFPW